MPLFLLSLRQSAYRVIIEKNGRRAWRALCAGMCLFTSNALDTETGGHGYAHTPATLMAEDRRTAAV